VVDDAGVRRHGGAARFAAVAGSRSDGAAHRDAGGSVGHAELDAALVRAGPGFAAVLAAAAGAGGELGAAGLGADGAGRAAHGLTPAGRRVEARGFGVLTFGGVGCGFGFATRRP
jgi:hypothetical protein